MLIWPVLREKMSNDDPNKPNKMPMNCEERLGWPKNKMPMSNVNNGLNEFNIPDNELLRRVPANENKKAGMT